MHQQVGAKDNGIWGVRGNIFPIYKHTLMRPGEMTYCTIKVICLMMMIKRK